MPNQPQNQHQRPLQAAPNSKPRLPKSYLATWGLLATLATSYLAITMMAPSLIGLPAHGSSSTIDFATSGGLSKNNTRHLQQKLSNAQLEIAKLRTRLSQQEEEFARHTQQQTQQRVAQAETPAKTDQPLIRPETTTAALNNAATGASIIKTQSVNTAIINADASEQAATELVIANMQIANAKKTKNPLPPSSIITGSIKIPPTPSRAPLPPLNSTRIIAPAKLLTNNTTLPATPAATNPIPVAPANTISIAANNTEPKMGVRLATGPSIDALRLKWNLMLDRAGASLSTLEPRFVPSTQPGVLGPTYDLIAGPLLSLSDAQRICNAAAVRSSICEIRKFEGSSTL